MSVFNYLIQFWMSVLDISVDIHIDIQAGIFMQGHSTMDIRKQEIFMNGYPRFTDSCLQLCMLLWISIWISLDFYGYPCIDLLWIRSREVSITYSVTSHAFFLPCKKIDS